MKTVNVPILTPQQFTDLVENLKIEGFIDIDKNTQRVNLDQDDTDNPEYQGKSLIVDKHRMLAVDGELVLIKIQGSSKLLIMTYTEDTEPQNIQWLRVIKKVL